MPFIQFQIRRDTSTRWTTNNPTLASGEMGLETNTGSFKIGDGVTAWRYLPYTSSGGGGSSTLSTFSTLQASTLAVRTISLSSIVDSNGNTGQPGQVLTTLDGQYVTWETPAAANSTFAELNVSSLRVDTLQGSTISNQIVLNASMIPALDNTYDLGAPGSSFRHLYVAGSSIFLGNSILTADAGGNVYIVNAEGYSTSVTGQVSSLNNLQVSSLQTSTIRGSDDNHYVSLSNTPGELDLDFWSFVSTGIYTPYSASDRLAISTIIPIDDLVVIQTSLIPGDDNLYTVGSETAALSSLYSHNIITSSLVTSSLKSLTIVDSQGNTGSVGQYLASQGGGIVWNTPSGGGSASTISTFTDLRTSTLQVSTINGQPYIAGTASTISSFSDLRASTLQVSTINGQPYIAGTASTISTFTDLRASTLQVSTINGLPPAAGVGPAGAIQYSDGAGNFQASSTLTLTLGSVLTGGPANNSIDFGWKAPYTMLIVASTNFSVDCTENIRLGCSTLEVNVSGLSGNSGQVLTSDGQYARWQTLPAGPTVSSFATLQVSTIKDSSGSVGLSGQVLTANGQYVTWQNPSGGGGSTISTFTDLNTSSLQVSSINGYPYTPGGGGGSTISTFTDLRTSSLQVSSINGYPYTPGGGSASTISTFTDLRTSTFQVSTINGLPYGAAGPVAGSIQFTDGNGNFLADSTFTWDPAKAILGENPGNNINFNYTTFGASIGGIKVNSIANIDLLAVGNIALNLSTLQITTPAGSGSAGQVLTSDGDYATWRNPASTFTELNTSSLQVSSINGYPYTPGGGGTTISSFNDLRASTLQVRALTDISTINGQPYTSGGSASTISTFTTLNTSSLHVSSINGQPYTPGTAAAAGPLGAIQYTDGNGVFQGSSIFSWDPSKSQLTAGPAGNSIEFGSGSEQSSIAIYTPADISIIATTGSILLNPSTLQINLLSGGSGTAGQVLTSDGEYATWQNPGGGGGTTISSFNDLRASTLQVRALTDISTINGQPYTSGGSSTIVSTFNTLNTSSLQVSSINGQPYTPGGGGSASTISTFTDLRTSTLQVSTINGFPYTARTLSENFTVAGSIMILYSYDGVSWTAANATVDNVASYITIAWNGSYWLTSHSFYLTSSYDGINWVDVTGPLPIIRGLAWNGSLWVAVGTTDNSYPLSPTGIVTSPDGINWTASTNDPLPNKTKNGVAWNGSYWVVVASSGGNSGAVIATSYDGMNWVARSSPFDVNAALGIAWNGSLWVAVGTTVATGAGIINGIATSSDGITWTERNTALTGTKGSVAWSGRLWAVASSSNYVITSQDGVTWAAARQIATLTNIGGITWNGTLWIATGTGQSGISAIATSPDAQTWTGQTTTGSGAGTAVTSRRVLPQTDNFSARTLYAPELTVSTINGYPYTPGGGGSASTISSFNDLTASTLQVSTINGLPYTSAAPTLSENFTVTGGNSIFYSYDGVSWIVANTPVIPTGTRYGTIAWNGSYWLAGQSVVVSGGASIIRSADGINWISSTSPLPKIAGLAWNGSLWVAVGDRASGGGGAGVGIATSSDGVNWTISANDPLEGDKKGVAWNGSYWVLVGNGGVGFAIATSYDGINWIGRSSPFNGKQAVGIAWNGSLWVAVGGDSLVEGIATSSDGIIWTERNNSLEEEKSSVAWNGSVWMVASSSSGKVTISVDGINWPSVYVVSTLTTIAGISWNGTRWIAMGDDSSGGGGSGIATSSDPTSWTAQTITGLVDGRAVASRRAPLIEPLQQDALRELNTSTLNTSTLKTSTLIDSVGSSGSLGMFLGLTDLGKIEWQTPSTFAILNTSTFQTSTLIDSVGSSGSLGMFLGLTNKGKIEWQTPIIVSSFTDLKTSTLRTSTLQVSTINGLPPAAAAGPAGAIQYSDGNGNFLADSTFTWNAIDSAIEDTEAGNRIALNWSIIGNDVNIPGNMLLESMENIFMIASTGMVLTTSTGTNLGLLGPNIGLNAVSGIDLAASTFKISIGAEGTTTSGTAGQVLTSDGEYATWQNPAGGGGGTTISTFIDLRTSTLQASTISVSTLTVSSINGQSPGGGGGTTISSFIDLRTSTLQASTISVSTLTVSSINGLSPSTPGVNPLNIRKADMYLSAFSSYTVNSTDHLLILTEIPGGTRDLTNLQLSLPGDTAAQGQEFTIRFYFADLTGNEGRMAITNNSGEANPTVNREEVINPDPLTIGMKFIYYENDFIPISWLTYEQLTPPPPPAPL